MVPSLLPGLPVPLCPRASGRQPQPAAPYQASRWLSSAWKALPPIPQPARPVCPSASNVISLNSSLEICHAAGFEFLEVTRVSDNHLYYSIFDLGCDSFVYLLLYFLRECEFLGPWPCFIIPSAQH